MSADPNCTTWTVVRLKDELRRLRLPLGGNKPELCRRLREHYASLGVTFPRFADFNPALVPSATPATPSRPRLPASKSIVPPPLIPKGPVPKLPYTQKQIADCGLGEDGYITDIISSDIIPPERVLTITDGNDRHCFDIATIAAIVRANPQAPLNPFNRLPLSREVLERVAAYNRQNEDNIRTLIQSMSNERTPLAVLKEQIAKIPDLNVETQPGGLTLLQRALRLNNRSALSALLNAGADPNFVLATGSNRGTELPLYWALQQGNPDYVMDLLNAGANPNPNPNVPSGRRDVLLRIFDLWGRSGLIPATLVDLLFQKGYRMTYRVYSSLDDVQRSLVDSILRKYNQPLPNLNASFDTIIDSAITSGYADDLVYLSEISSFQYSRQMQDGISPSTGMSFLRTALVKQPNNIPLLEAVLRPLTRISPADVAAAPTQVSRQLVNAARLRTLGRDLFDAAANGNIVEVRRLLDEGVNPNFVLEGESSPLAIAVNRSHWDVARLLMDRGALRGDTLQTSLRILSARNGPLDLAQRMVDAGAVPTGVLYDIYDRGGDVSAQRLLYLMNLGAIPSEDDAQAYRTAIQDNNVELFNRLLDLGLPLREIDYRLLGRQSNPAFLTALQDHGISLNNGTLFRSFVASGNVAAINQLGNMIGPGNIIGINEALELAAGSGSSATVSTLIDLGANPLVNDQAALRRAIANDNATVVGLFSRRYPREMAALQRR